MADLEDPRDLAIDHQRRRQSAAIARLPARFRGWVHWLLEPRSRFARIPVAILLMLGGLLCFLPGLGFWMLPLGVILLA